MDMITTIRSQVVPRDPEPRTPPVQGRAMPAGAEPSTASPVAAPLTRQAAPQPVATSQSSKPQGSDFRDSAEASAEAKARAARLAYIEASIAAGVSPLPLP